MKSITFEDLLSALIMNKYTLEEIEIIKKAYEFARIAHEKGKPRDSGEPFIIHPLAVAYKFALRKADVATIVASLNHDTVEDVAEITLDMIKAVFGREVVKLIDGVTKINKLVITNKAERDAATIRKLIKSSIKDIRIIMIKLEDRLHNIQTLNFKPEQKQKEYAYETLVFYAPLSFCIGAFDICRELEDRCLGYISTFYYDEIILGTQIIKEQTAESFNSTLMAFKNIFDEMASSKIIDYEIFSSYKSAYRIFKQLNYVNENIREQIEKIPDLRTIKILVPTTSDCYSVLEIVDNKFQTIAGSFIDYIKNPQINLHQSLNKNVIDKNGLMAQVEIKTFDMYQIERLGLMAAWGKNHEQAVSLMQKKAAEMQIHQRLAELASSIGDDIDFETQAKDIILKLSKAG